MAQEKYSNKDVSKRLRDITGDDPENITPELLCKLAQEGDSLAKSIFEKMGKYLGIGIANLINILNLELIIIGGGLLPAWEFFIEEAITQIKMRTYKIPGERVQILQAKCGNDAGLLGSAFMAWKGIK
jgi:glucokinase